jgi:exopolyphosphatase / guanosine-5'-triphosphate,3'-diphosphate pyrophosphatase
MTLERPAVIDIGSNSVRLVIYEDFSSAMGVFYNEKFSCKLGRFTDNGYLTEKAKIKTIQAVQRFSKICEANNVTIIKAIATAAMRDAKDGKDFSIELSKKTGLNIEVISGSDEAYYSARGVGYKMPNAIGCMGDLGGGSLELSILNQGVVSDNRISVPLGVLRLQNDVGDAFHHKDYAHHIDTVLSDIAFDIDDDVHHNFYCVGGSWRALISFYIQAHHIELAILQGFTVSSEKLCLFIKDILSNEINIIDYNLPQMSKRRLSAIPTAGLLLLKLIEKFKFDTVIVSVAGLREGVLMDILPSGGPYESSALAFAASEASMRSRNPLLYPYFIIHVTQILPDLSPRFFLLAKIITYLSDIAYRRHVDFRAEYVFDFVLFSNLDDLTHSERIVVAIAVAWRYNPDFQIPERFSSYIKHETHSMNWGRAVALILRYLYSITGISHLVASDLKFIRHQYTLEQISAIGNTNSGNINVLLPEGETSYKRFQALIKHLFD